MRVLVINGPNLNMLGMRDKKIYGEESYSDLCEHIKKTASLLNMDVDIFQSNSEGAIIDRIQDACYDIFDGVVINAGAYTHYSYAIHDALEILHCPVIEVHLSNIEEREDFRRHSVIADVATARFFGKGFQSYDDALNFLLKGVEITNNII